MAMTEKQGGSDLRANATVALPEGSGGPAATYRLTGHKWFMSAPMCDAFLVLAQAPGGLSCFFMPRWMPDGTLNAIRIQRLKDKLGNKSNASSEVEFENAWARLAVIRRIVKGARRRQRGEFKDDDPVRCRTFERLGVAAADHVPAAVPRDRRRGERTVAFIGNRIGNLDFRDQIAGHVSSQRIESLSRRCERRSSLPPVVVV